LPPLHTSLYITVYSLSIHPHPHRPIVSDLFQTAWRKQCFSDRCLVSVTYRNQRTRDLLQPTRMRKSTFDIGIDWL